MRERIEAALFKGKIVLIYGARQVGKTTLVRDILAGRRERSLYLNCDEPEVRAFLTERNSLALRRAIGMNTQIAVIDEAQRVRDIGITLKLLVDNYPDLQVIATGSSALELSNRIAEPLTGRKIIFHLYPLSLGELASQETALDTHMLLEQRLLYGTYPGVVNSDDPEATIREIAGSYLYRDVLEYQAVKNSDLLRQLLQALALQVGNEVSLNELGAMLGLDKVTVQRYLSLLEQAYVLFQLPPFSRNLRKELSKKRKVFFYDLGVRNALLGSFQPLALRPDVGALWENYVIAERLKRNHNRGYFPNVYFWRTYDQQELDYLEEYGGKLTGFECKWRPGRWQPPLAFLAAYPGSEVHLVDQKSFPDYLLS
ncbi:MAG: ATP-binding protein [Anaerolineae bacterium]